MSSLPVRWRHNSRALPRTDLRGAPPPASLSVRSAPGNCPVVSSSIHLFVKLIVSSLFVCPSVRPSASVRPFARPPVCRPLARLSTHPSVHPSVRSSVRPSVRPSVRSSVRLFVRPSVRPSAYQSIRSRFVFHNIRSLRAFA